MTMLQGKYAVVLGAGGSIGSAVAREFAGEGAEVFLAGRTAASLDAVAKQIAANGGRAHTCELDALDDKAVNEYMDRVVRRTGRIDIAFNAVGPRVKEYANATLAVDIGIDEFMRAMNTVVKAQFITARAAARHMVKQRSGVVIFLTGSPARGHVQGATAIGAAFGAIESLSENLALELGAAGVRSVCLRTTVDVDSRTIQDTMDIIASHMNITKEQAVAEMTSLNFLKAAATTADTAKAAAFLASDAARMMTGTVVNATAGAAAD